MRRLLGLTAFAFLLAAHPVAASTFSSPSGTSAPIHSSMIAATPAPGSTVTEFKEITIEFEGDLAAGAEHTISVLTPEGEVAQKVDAQLLSSTTLFAEIDEPDGGNWIVRFDIVSADDGVAQNSLYLFTFDKPPSDFPTFVVSIVAAVVLAVGIVLFVVLRRRRRAQIVGDSLERSQ